MISSLMMYQRPELTEEHNRFWELIRQNLVDEGIDSPEHLSQNEDEFYVWKHPELVLSQTCGMPYRTWLYDQVSLIGTPDYGLEGCQPGYYRSAIVVRENDTRSDVYAFKDAVFAYNQEFSQSGYAAPFWHLTNHGFWFKNRLHTGQHLVSARAVANKDADIAALDAVSWRLMQVYEPFCSKLRVLAWTTPTPGLPLIASKNANIEGTYSAVENAITALNAADRAKLGLRGLVRIPKADYLAIPNPE